MSLESIETAPKRRRTGRIRNCYLRRSASSYVLRSWRMCDLGVPYGAFTRRDSCPSDEVDVAMSHTGRDVRGRRRRVAAEDARASEPSRRSPTPALAVARAPDAVHEDEHGRDDPRKRQVRCEGVDRARQVAAFTKCLYCFRTALSSGYICGKCGGALQGDGRSSSGLVR